MHITEKPIRKIIIFLKLPFTVYTARKSHKNWQCLLILLCFGDSVVRKRYLSWLCMCKHGSEERSRDLNDKS